jgi:hypothetical protein
VVGGPHEEVRPLKDTPGVVAVVVTEVAIDERPEGTRK